MSDYKPYLGRESMKKWNEFWEDEFRKGVQRNNGSINYMNTEETKQSPATKEELEQAAAHALKSDRLEELDQAEAKAENHLIQAIAQVCHEANRAYCETIGDTSQLPWSEAPQWQRNSALLGVKFHMKNLNATPDASHNSWLKQKEEDGWKYGVVKNAETKEHPCFVPYDQLPVEQQMKDYIFGAIAKAMIGKYTAAALLVYTRNSSL